MPRGPRQLNEKLQISTTCSKTEIATTKELPKDSSNEFAGCLAGNTTGWQSWQVGRLANWHTGWQAIDSVVGWQVGWLAGKLAGWLAGWLTAWLAGWLGSGHLCPCKYR
jgi:hypothetical protein